MIAKAFVSMTANREALWSGHRSVLRRAELVHVVLSGFKAPWAQARTVLMQLNPAKLDPPEISLRQASTLLQI